MFAYSFFLGELSWSYGFLTDKYWNLTLLALNILTAIGFNLLKNIF